MVPSSKLGIEVPPERENLMEAIFALLGVLASCAVSLYILVPLFLPTPLPTHHLKASSQPPHGSDRGA